MKNEEIDLCTKLELGPNKVIEDRKCPKCGGILITNYGPGISCTFCIGNGHIDSGCSYNDYDYDFE